MKKYYIYDACEDPSPAIYSNELGKPLTLERFLELLKLEIESYYECYKDAKEMTKQFIQNISEVLNGKPIQINGMEFIVEEE